jgi:hypothetical protein
LAILAPRNGLSADTVSAAAKDCIWGTIRGEQKGMCASEERGGCGGRIIMMMTMMMMMVVMMMMTIMMTTSLVTVCWRTCTAVEEVSPQTRHMPSSPPVTMCSPAVCTTT